MPIISSNTEIIGDEDYTVIETDEKGEHRVKAVINGKETVLYTRSGTKIILEGANPCESLATIVEEKMQEMWFQSVHIER